jgi:signal transduction histidine kinase
MATEMEQFKAGFLARVSHELRSPLNGLIGMHQLILADLCDSPEEEREFLAQANDSSMKMVKMLDDILDVSKAQYGKQKLNLQPISLSDLLDEVYALTYLLAKDRNLALQVIPPEPDIKVLGDARRLTQVLVNFINTAILHMQEGGISVWAEANPNVGRATIGLEAPVPLEFFKEPLDYLSTPVSRPAASKLSPEQQKQQTIAYLSVAETPPPGLTLLANQILVETMGGQLELSADSADPNLCQIRCLLPLAAPEPISVG